MSQVSIIIPCYNQAKYLDECLNSVLDQTFTEWECIIVDDGSPDNTKEISEKWCAKNSKFMYAPKENGGAPSARNYGVSLSNFEYVLLIDADDYIDKKFLEKTIPILKSNQNICAVGSYVQCFGNQNFVWECKGGTLKNFLIDNNVCISCLMRKSDFNQIGGFNISLKGWQDWDFWIRLTAQGKRIEVVKEPIFYYRKKEESITTETMSKFKMMTEKIISNNIDLYRESVVEIITFKNEKILELQNKIYYYQKFEKNILFRGLRYVLYKLGILK